MESGSKMLLIMLALLFMAIPHSELNAADITPFIGGIKPGSLSLGGVKTALDSSPVYGIRLASTFFPALGHEHTLAFSSDYLIPTSVKSIRDANGFVYSSNLILNLPFGRAVPYVTAGLGLVHQYGSEELPVGTRFAINYGGGLKLKNLLGPLGLRFDVRGYTATGLSSGKLNMLEMSAGLLITIGK